MTALPHELGHADALAGRFAVQLDGKVVGEH
jgi:hypothetical protein